MSLPETDKARRGYMTVARCQGVEVALYHDDLTGLQKAFEAITKQTFHPVLAQPVGVMKLDPNQKTI